MTYLADAMTALYTALSSALSATPAGLPGVTVELGVVPSVAQDEDFIIVGHDGTQNPDGSLSLAPEAGTVTSVFAAMGPGIPPQQENGTVHCVLVSQTGDSSDLTGRIAAAETLLNLCQGAGTDLHAAVTGGSLVFGAVQDARLYTRQSAAGCVAEFTWTWPYDAPWGS